MHRFLRLPMRTPRAARIAVGIAFISACAQAPSVPTADQLDPVQVLQSFSKTRGPKISLGTISASAQSVPVMRCRAAGYIRPPGGVTYVKYIEQALIDQFTLAPGYAANSPIRLEGHLDRIDFSSINPGKWEIDMTFRADGITPFKIKSVHHFTASFNVDVACAQVTEALGDATRDLLARLVVHPSFQQFLAGTK
jgi:hypothetical protein